MTGNRDEAGATEGDAPWLDAVFERLRTLTDQAIAVVAAAEPPKDTAEAEKQARAVGVLARTAKAVAALKTAVSAKIRNAQEDAMSEDDAERDRAGRSAAGRGTGGAVRRGGLGRRGRRG